MESVQACSLISVGVWACTGQASTARRALAANGNLCAVTKTVTVKKKVTVKRHGKVVRNKHGKVVYRTKKVAKTEATTLSMPTAFVGQNGAEIHESTPVSVTGCPKTIVKRTKKTKAKKKVRHERGKSHGSKK